MLRTRTVLCLSLCLLEVFPTPAAYAESLDDPTIRHIYAEKAAVVRDPLKTRHLMEERLDERFSIKSNLTLTVGTTPPRDIPTVLDKTGAIDDAMKSSGTMTIEDYRYAVTNIKMSDDKKFAYVQDTTASTGTMALNDPTGHSLTAHYTASQGCLDLLTLKSEKIVHLKSECNAKLTLTE